MRIRSFDGVQAYTSQLTYYYLC